MEWYCRQPACSLTPVHTDICPVWTDLSSIAQYIPQTTTKSELDSDSAVERAMGMM